MRLRENFSPEIDDLAYEDVDSGAPATQRRYFADGGYADVGTPIPGSGRPTDQVELKSTDMRPYMAIPDLAKQEAEVTKARYGGSSIQDSAGAPYEKPKAPGESGPAFDRGKFEKVVFGQMGGNPFEIDVIREVDRITAAELPKIFAQAFRGQAIWEDRGRLNKKQMEFWQDEVKRFRAHVKERVDSERRTKIDTYNFMMKNFDNEAKEREAALKRVQDQEKDFLSRRKDEAKNARTEMKDMQARMERLQGDKRQILKRQAEIIREGTDLKTGELTPEAEAEFTELANQLKYVNTQTHKMLMASDPEYRTQQAAKNVPSEVQPSHAKTQPKPQAAEEEPKPAGKQPEVVRKKLPETADTGKYKFAPHPLGNPVEVRRHKSGRLMGKMQDGTIVWLDEVNA